MGYLLVIRIKRFVLINLIVEQRRILVIFRNSGLAELVKQKLCL